MIISNNTIALETRKAVGWSEAFSRSGFRAKGTANYQTDIFHLSYILKLRTKITTSTRTTEPLV